MSISPAKEVKSLPSCTAPITIHRPPSPTTHRIRRLQSAQTLGSENSRNGHIPSLISQQRQHQQQSLRNFSPIRKDLQLTPSAASLQRGRSNSDAPTMNITTSNDKRLPAAKKSLPGDSLSLDRLIRDGPPDGDLLSGLESTRLKILDQGIKSDSDGMVGELL